MDCKKFSELIYSYLDGELYENEISEFTQHLEKCSSCSALFKQKKQTIELLNSLSCDSPDYIPNAMEKINFINNKKQTRHTRKIILAVSTVAALAIVTISLGNILSSKNSASYDTSFFNNSSPYYETYDSAEYDSENLLDSSQGEDFSDNYYSYESSSDSKYDNTYEFTLYIAQYDELKAILYNDEVLSKYVDDYQDYITIHITNENKEDMGAIINRYIPSVDLNADEYINICYKNE